MKKTNRKLAMRREIVRALAVIELVRVAGGQSEEAICTVAAAAPSLAPGVATCTAA